MSASPVLVAAVGEARGARAAAAALACAGASEEGAGLLVEVGGGGRPRPGLLAGAMARGLEERLAGHLPEAAVAARGSICVVSLGGAEEALERLGGALAIGRDVPCVVHVEPRLLRPALEVAGSRTAGALLRADLPGDRALVALACADLIGRGLRVGVLKREPGWLAARLAMAGVADPRAKLPERLVRRLLKEPGGEDEAVE
jgi:hypothetical protein